MTEIIDRVFYSRMWLLWVIIYLFLACWSIWAAAANAVSLAFRLRNPMIRNNPMIRKSRSVNMTLGLQIIGAGIAEAELGIDFRLTIDAPCKTDYLSGKHDSLKNFIDGLLLS